MAGTAGPTSSIDAQLLFKTANVSAVLTDEGGTPPATYATATAAATGFTITGSATDRIMDVTDIGSHGRTSNTGSFVVYGEGVEKQFALPASREEFTFSYAEDNSNAKHNALSARPIGSDIAVAVHQVVGAGASIYVMVGEISGITREMPVGTQTTVTVTVAVNRSTTLPLHKA